MLAQFIRMGKTNNFSHVIFTQLILLELCMPSTFKYPKIRKIIANNANFKAPHKLS